MAQKELPGFPRIEVVIEKAMDLYRRTYRSEAMYAGFGPGRMNILGDHSEINEGFVYAMAMPLITVLVGTPNGIDDIYVMTEENAAKSKSIQAVFRIPAKGKLEPGKPEWANYIKGVVNFFPGDVLGFNCAVVTTIPVGSGLGSRAALAVGTCSLLEVMFNTKLDMQTRIDICSKTDQLFSEQPGSSVDIIVSVRGSLNKTLVVDCRTWEVEELNFDTTSVVFLAVNSKVKRGPTHQKEIADRQHDCKTVAQLMKKKSLRDAWTSNVDNLLKEGVITESMGLRSKHIIRESMRVYEAVHATLKMDLDALGFLMTQSHNSLKETFGTTCSEVDHLVEILSTTEGVLGCRMTGPGFGGCVMCLVKRALLLNVINEIKEKYTEYDPEFYMFTPSSGGRFVNLKSFNEPQIPSLYPP